MYSFKNDYSEFAHPTIVSAIASYGLLQNDGYGLDKHSARAAELICQKCGCPGADVHMMVGGTPANLVAIAAFSRPHHAVIAAHTGHINVHETGAIEATGHKVLAMYAEDGKLTPQLVEAALEEHPGDEHMVKPHMVYISNSTELGTIYTKKELEALRDVCKANHLLFYMDGARLGSALTAKGNDLTLADLPKYFDAFYIGATKNGGLLGEALVICNDSLKEDFRYILKQRGGMLAKGFLIGVQFEELFRGDLFFELARHANAMADKLREGFAKIGVPMLINSPTNLLFPILPNPVLEKLEEKYVFSVNSKPDANSTCIRVVTSWATDEKQVDALLSDLANLYNK